MSHPPQWFDALQTGLALLRQDRPADGLAALEALESRHPQDPLCRALARDGMGRALLALQRPDEAVEALRQSVDLLREAKGEAAPMTLGAMQNLTNILLGLGRREAAAALSSDVVRLSEAAHGPESPQFAVALLPLASMHYRSGELDEAEALLRRGQAIWERQDAPTPELGTCLNNLGRIHEERGQLEEGIALHRRAVDLRRQLLGEHEDTAFSLGNLGVALASAGHWQEAAATLREAVELYDRLGRGQSPEARGYSNNLGVCLQALARDAAPTGGANEDQCHG